ncbi:MAG: sigma-70 family RNA polymerase sigma factor [Candidatus Eisenbacteria bacterium]|uniref:Sigma-70 family RNA polymerase sigma factor n=1 Tax=Eiseniibacteriota bacterium TaxID=2212470 RepID=A0A538SCD0_UNCEI|nr:MAG: sigma-70 family RNA polymerase sigma factor [Candidatus Eisenbacteria bacterium]
MWTSGPRARGAGPERGARRVRGAEGRRAPGAGRGRVGFGARLPVSVDYGVENDEDLVRRAQGGDTRAFDELVRRYRDKVYRLSFKILRHEEDAAEALQDAFLSAYRGIKSFKVESTFSTWLYRIATNASLMKYRKRREGHVSLEQSQNTDENAEMLQIPDWSTQPLKELLDSETREVMDEGIQRLPEELRTVFILRDIEDLSNAEVAQILDLTVAAVKSRLHRARIALRDRLTRYFADKMTRKDRGRV